MTQIRDQRTEGEGRGREEEEEEKEEEEEEEEEEDSNNNNNNKRKKKEEETCGHAWEPMDMDGNQSLVFNKNQTYCQLLYKQYGIFILHILNPASPWVSRSI